MPQIVRWLGDFEQSWWDDAFESNEVWPQNLDDREMDEYVRFKSPNMAGVGLAGFFRITNHTPARGIVHL
eukprot:UN13845